MTVFVDKTFAVDKYYEKIQVELCRGQINWKLEIE